MVARRPAAHALAEHRPDVLEPAARQQRGRQRRARPGVAHDRRGALRVERREIRLGEQAIGHGQRTGRELALLRGLAHVHDLQVAALRELRPSRPGAIGSKRACACAESTPKPTSASCMKPTAASLRTASSACSCEAATITTSRSASSAKPQRLPNPATATGSLNEPAMWPSAKLAPSRTSSTWASAAGQRDGARARRRAQQGAAVELHDAPHRRGLGRQVGVRALDELLDRHLREHRVEAALEAERGRGLGRHAPPAQRARDVSREQLHAGVEPAEALVQRAVQRRGPLVAGHGEVGPPAVADEERVAREHEPRLVAARAVGHDQAAVLGAVPGRVEHVQRDVADVDAVGVAQRPVLVDGVRDLVDRDPAAVLLRQHAVTGDVVGVRVRLDHAHQAGAVALAQGEHLAHVQRRIDDHGLAGCLAAHEIGGTAQVAPHDLLEDHASNPSPRAITRRWISFVPSPISRIFASR